MQALHWAEAVSGMAGWYTSRATVCARALVKQRWQGGRPHKSENNSWEPPPLRLKNQNQLSAQDLTDAAFV